jgi:hypothetical protein
MRTHYNLYQHHDDLPLHISMMICCLWSPSKLAVARARTSLAAPILASGYCTHLLDHGGREPTAETCGGNLLSGGLPCCAACRPQASHSKACQTP